MGRALKRCDKYANAKIKINEELQKMGKVVVHNNKNEDIKVFFKEVLGRFA